MVTSAQALKKYGDPATRNDEGLYMVTWEVPSDIREELSHVRFSALGTIGFPTKIYLNKDIQEALEEALRNVISNGFAEELKTWDGCFIIRNSRGLRSWSMHSWGLAIDLNAATNRLGATPTLSAGFVKCFTDAGFDWGGLWKRKDGMHFQIAKI